jgi:hypothetical protein
MLSEQTVWILAIGIKEGNQLLDSFGNKIMSHESLRVNEHELLLISS